MNAPSQTTGVFTVDRDLIVVSWDDWMADATGVAASEARGRFIGDLYPDLIDRGMIERLQHVIATGFVEVLATAFHQYLIPVPPRNPRSSFDRMRQFVTMMPRGDREGGVIVKVEDVTDRFETDGAEASRLSDSDETVRLRAIRSLADRPDPSIVAPALADPSWRVRREAAGAIAKSTDEHAVGTLIAAIRERHRDPAILNASLTALALSAADVVGPVGALLNDPDHDVRTYAALALGLLRDPRGAPLLLAHIEDSNDNVRFHVIEALGRIGDRSTAERIATVAESRDFAVAFVALDALAEIGEPSVAPRLLPLIEDALLGEPAVHCIGRLGSEEVVGPLMDLLARPEAPVRTTAVALQEIFQRLDDYFDEGDLVADLARGTSSPAAVDQLLKAIPGANDLELRGLVTVLGWLRGQGIDSALAPLLSHPVVGPHVADVLGRRGIDAAPDIINAGRDLSGSSRRLAATALHRIGWDVTTPLLVTWLEDDPEVIVAAAGALGAIGDSRAFYPLLRLLGHPMASVRQAAVSALHSIGHTDMPALIATRLNDPAPEVRESAIRVAGYFGYPRSLDRMIALASDPVASVRRTAVESLANFDDRIAWVAIATAAGGDPDPSVRAAAVRACRDPRSREVDRVVEESLDDRSLWVRYHGIHAMKTRAKYPNVAIPAWLPSKLLERARLDPAPPVRIAAFEAIADLRIERGIPALIAALADPEPDIASSAAAALGKFNVPESRAALELAIEGDDPQVQRAAIEALGRLRDDTAVDSIRRLAEGTYDSLTRDVAISALAAIGSAASTNALVGLLADRDCRAAASRALAAASGDSLAALIAGLRNPDAGVRCSIVEILGRVKRADVSRTVSRVLEDDVGAVRTAAEQALTRRDLHDVDTAIASAAEADQNSAVRRAASSVVDRS